MRRTLSRIFVVLAAALLFASKLPAQVDSPDSSQEGAQTRFSNEPGKRGPINESYGRLPLRFEPNVGQSDPAVRFLVRGSGYTVFLTDHEAVLKLGRPAARPREQKGRPDLARA